MFSNFFCGNVLLTNKVMFYIIFSTLFFFFSFQVAKRVEQLLDTKEQIEIVGETGEIILAANINSQNWTTIAEAEIPSTSNNSALVTTATSNVEISIPKESFSVYSFLY